MKTKIKRHSRAVISVILAISMLVSCMMVGIIATDAAYDNSERVGANYYLLIGNNDSNPKNWTKYVSSSSQSFTIKPSDIGETSFSSSVNYYVGISSSTSISGMWSQSAGSLIGTTSGDISTFTQDYNVDGASYKFAGFRPKNNSVGSVTITTSFDSSNSNTTYNFSASEAAVDTWTVVGDNTTLFGTAWAPTATDNDMATSDNNIFTWTKQNVALTAGTIYYKVAKDHAWGTTYPAANKAATVPSDGNYNVTVTYNNTSHEVNMELELIPKSTLTVASVENATVTATYNGTTIGEGSGSIQNIPRGAAVTVKVTPDASKKCTAVTGTYDGGTVSATKSGSSWTFAMPGANTEVSASIGNVTLKKVYFNNYYSRYSMVSAYAWKGEADQSSITDEPLGAWPGKTMTRIENTNTWEIEVYDDTQYIIFRGDDGYNTYVDTNNYEHITIPWNTYTAPKYTAGSVKTSPTTNGTWGEYVARSNDYTVTPGNTLNDPNLFTAINATFYDYYVDNEVTGGWLTGITAEGDYKCSGSTNDPYRNKLNAALSNYASSNSVTYPLYFGNNKSTNSSDLTNFNQRANNADGLSPDTTSIYGLAGNTLAGSTIHHYSSTATNNNGAAMAMFDEDFLSGENSQGTALASILRSSNFPVRKIDNYQAGEYQISSIYLYPDNFWKDANAWFIACFRNNGDSNTDYLVKMEKYGSTDYYYADIPAGYENAEIHFIRKNPSTSVVDWNTDKWNEINSLIMPTDNKVIYQTSTSKWISAASVTVPQISGHTYYQYDSTNGIDNAFITNINKGNTPETRTAQINYYPQSEGKTVKSQNNKIGFFPFDYNNVISGEFYPTDTIYVDVSSVSGANYYGAYLFGGGNEATWITLTQDSGNTYKFDNSAGYETVILTRGETEEKAKDFDNSWNRTGDIPIPDGSDNKIKIKLEYDDTQYNTRGMKYSYAEVAGLTPVKTGYAEASHLAHDQGFGVKLEIPFTLGANGLNEDGTAQTFDFSGDDDLWVFIDDQLVLDLGGAHNATTGSINFNTLKAVSNTTAAVASGNGTSREVSFNIDNSANAVNTVHTMTIYYMERGMFDSNLKFGFSFHAIPNLLNVDKKVRTANVNPGFFDATTANTATNSSGVAYKNSQDKNITQFEHTYQGDYVSTDTGVTVPTGQTLKTESFAITQGSTTAPKNADVTYSIGSNSTTVTPSGSNYSFDYNLYNDWVASFVGQYDGGQVIKLKESVPNDSLYKYDQSFEATYVSNNNAVISSSGDSSTGYSFTMPASTGTGMDDVRVRARFTNQMKVHDLTISKDLNVDGPEAESAEFTIQVLFKFGNYDYTAYPLYCVVDGANAKMSNDGKITLRKNHTVTIKGIPENAQVQIKEILDDNTYGYNSTTLTGSADNQTTVAYGKQFTMGEGDVDAVVRNTLGALTITHELHNATEGFGTCYASAKVKNGNADVYSYAETTGQLEISPQYIKYDSTYNLEITLRTVPSNGATVMDSFWEQVTSDSLAQLTSSSNLGLNATVTVNASSSPATATITFPIAKLFNQTTQAQNITNMPFFSKLATWKWRMIFDVLSYRGLYENMQYVTGVVPFTETEWSQMTKTTSGADENGTTVQNIPDFETDDQRTAFINSHAPYENGFKTDYTWNTALASKTGKDTDMAIKVNNSTRTITYIAKASGGARGPVYVLFDLPYSATYANKLYPTADANGDIAKTTDYMRIGERNESYRTAYEGHYTISSKFVKAPEKILVSGSKSGSTDTRVYKYFSYWEVYTQETDKYPSKLYTKCYYPEFNLTLYQDSIIKAVYNNDSYVSPSNMALNDDNAAGGGTATINFMENSRTQWTEDSETLRIAAKDGSNVTSSYHNGGDRIYTDFLISYTYNDLQLNTSTDTGLTPGLIVETAGELPVNQTTGLYETKDQAYYEANYDNTKNDTALRDFIKSSSKSSGNYLKSEFTLSQLDNKNRINYYYSLPNISHSTLKATTRKNMVYRAYTYLRNNAGAVIISNPVYFTIYDIASIANTKDGDGSKGVS